MKNLKNALVLLYGSILILSCGGSGSSDASSKEKPVSKKEEQPAEVAAKVTLTIEGNDLMQFNTNKMEVVEGQEVTVVLKHVGQMSVDAMGHNWVLLAAGTDIPAFGMAAVSAKETGYIPQDLKDKVIANTITIGGGEETTVTFTAPKAGYYTFICSFPGHYGVMQGSFVSSPR